LGTPLLPRRTFFLGGFATGFFPPQLRVGQIFDSRCLQSLLKFYFPLSLGPPLSFFPLLAELVTRAWVQNICSSILSPKIFRASLSFGALRVIGHWGPPSHFAHCVFGPYGFSQGCVGPFKRFSVSLLEGILPGVP